MCEVETTCRLPVSRWAFQTMARLRALVVAGAVGCRSASGTYQGTMDACVVGVLAEQCGGVAGGLE